MAAVGVCGLWTLWLTVAVGFVVDVGSRLWFIIFILSVFLYYFYVVYVKIKVLIFDVL